MLAVIIIMVILIIPQPVSYASSLMFSDFSSPHHHNGEVNKRRLSDQVTVAEKIGV